MKKIDDDTLIVEWQTCDRTDPGSFDKGMARLFDCTVGTVRRARSRLKLEPLTSSGLTKDVYKQVYDQVLQEERERFDRGQASGLRKELLKQVKRDWISEVVSSRIKAMKPPAPISPPFSLYPRGKEELCLMVSDMHYGGVTDTKWVGGLAKFNKEVFEKRFEDFISKTISLIIERRLVKDITSLNIFLLGDLVDGEAIFQGHAHEVDVSVVDQVLHTAQSIAFMVTTLSRYVPSIHISCVVGNHGRVSKDAPVGDNWEVLLYKMVEAFLGKNDCVSIDAGRSFWKTVDVLGKTVLLIHGDQVNSINCTSVEKFVGRYRAMLDDKLHAVCLGHHHTFRVMEVNGVEVMVNPAFVSSSNYGIGKLSLCSDPGQILFGVTPEDGIAWRQVIKL